MPKPDIGRESQFLFQLQGTHWNITIRFGVEKLERCGLTVKICLLSLTQSANVTDSKADGRMDRQTDTV